VARELHDDLSQQIAAVSIGISNLKRKMPPHSEAVAQAERVRQKLVQLAESTRRLSHELHPAVLQHSGLAAALRNYCAEFAALTSHHIAFRSEGAFDLLPPGVALCVYRVAQEALQNSIKHAKVDAAEVNLKNENGVLSLVVSDCGVGMDPNAASGLGLVSIKERTRLVNGTVEVKSRPGEGVTLTLKVPVPSEVAHALVAASGAGDSANIPIDTL
jgi:two-component system sensor histidine kinase UhpB